MILQTHGDRTRREDPNIGERSDGFGTQDSVIGERSSRNTHGTQTHKVSFLFDPDYYANWSGRRTSRFSIADKAISLVIFLLAVCNLIHAMYFNNDTSYIFSNSPIVIFGFFTISVLCVMMGINSESPGKFKQLSITTFSMWLLSLVILTGIVVMTRLHIDYKVNTYLFLPAASTLFAYTLIGISGIVYIFNTINSILRLRWLSIGIMCVGVFGFIQYLTGPFYIDGLFTKSASLISAFIFLLTGLFFNIVSKKVSALYDTTITNA